MDTLHGAEQWMPDCLHSLRPQMTQLNLSLEPLGDFETLSERLHAEVKAFHTATPLPDLASAARTTSSAKDPSMQTLTKTNPL